MLLLLRFEKLAVNQMRNVPFAGEDKSKNKKLELFARMHNTHAGWMSLGNQLNGVRLVDEGLRARFKAAYPEVEV
ncbi:hypothetical protein OROHE_025097 [Orobanche hederae]